MIDKSRIKDLELAIQCKKDNRKLIKNADWITSVNRENKLRKMANEIRQLKQQIKKLEASEK